MLKNKKYFLKKIPYTLALWPVRELSKRAGVELPHK